MPLQSSKLKQQLVDIQRNPPPTYQEAGKRWAAAYAAYAADALSPLGGTPASLAAAESVLGNLLGVTFATSRDVNQTAQQFGTAFTAFWFLPPVVFSGTPPGVVTLVGGAAVLPTALVATWLANSAAQASVEQCMSALAAALDTFTRTVIVTHATVPVPTIGPIS